MALKDAPTPEIKPLGSPQGRFDTSPLHQTQLGGLFNPDLDNLAYEGAGGLEKGPISIDTRLGDQFNDQLDKLAREGVGGLQSGFPETTNPKLYPSEVDKGVIAQPAGTKHNSESTTLGTGAPAQLGKPDPFANLK